MTDIVIIGSGPAGLQAAIHVARAKKSVVVLGKQEASALAGTRIVNYFGCRDSKGDDLLSVGAEQAVSSGAALVRQNVVSASRDGDAFRIGVEDGTEFVCSAVILAMGVSRKKLNIPGEKEFFGKGVSYCAVCDCNFYKGVPIMIVGDESEAAHSAELMTKYASDVYWATQDTDVDPVMMKRAIDAGVYIVNGHPAEIRGDDHVRDVVMPDGSVITVHGVFIELGGRSSDDIAMDLDVFPEMDSTIKIDSDCMTEVPGVFACGDITGKPWQIAKAVGQGNIAGLAAAEYVGGKR